MGIYHRASHGAFVYASEDAYLAHVVNFVATGVRAGEHVLLFTTSAHWSQIQLRLTTAGIDVAASRRQGGLVVGDAATVLEQVMVGRIFEPHRLQGVLQLLLGDSYPPQRFYGDVASLLVANDNLPASVALEQTIDELMSAAPLVVSCGYGLQQFHDSEHDWQIRCVLNGHDEAAIEPGAWMGPVANNRASRLRKRAELILLWDDYPDTRTMYAEALTFSGYRVITAADATEAFAFGKAYRPDLLILDVRLPEKIGAATMRRLRNGGEFRAPILALTAHAFAVERDDILQDGFDVVLSKPCLPDELVASVAHALNGRSDR